VKKVAHGETVGWLASQINQPRMGRQKISSAMFRSPRLGLNYFALLTHGFTVGYYRSLLRS
jgi:hypothetical protein